MSARQFRKDDIEFHGTNGPYHSAPAVNIKVHFPSDRNAQELARRVATDHGADDREAAAFAEWATSDTTELPDGGWEDRDPPINAEDVFYSACESEFEFLQDSAEDIFGRKVTLYQTGRSGGWVYVDGITREDVDHWDALDVAKWGRFAKLARQITDDVPYQMFSLLFFNGWETARELLDANENSAGLAPIGLEG